MNTDEERSEGRSGLVFLDGWKITFISVFICVHLWLKFFFTESLRLYVELRIMWS